MPKLKFSSTERVCGILKYKAKVAWTDEAKPAKRKS